jgi:hypothetical protein
MEVVAGDYERTVQRIEPGLEYLLTRLAEEPEQLAQVPDFAKQVRALVDASRTTAEGALALRQTSLDIGLVHSRKWPKYPIAWPVGANWLIVSMQRSFDSSLSP